MGGSRIARGQGVLVGLAVLWGLEAAAAWAAGAGLKTEGIPLAVKQTQHCSAFAPGGWSFGTNPQASAAEAVSADRTMYAGWGVIAINRAMQPYYGDLYGDPETSIRFLGTQVVRALGDPSGMRYTSSPQLFLGYFALRSLESAGNAGLVFYRVYPGQNPSMYVESVYWAIANKAGWPARIRVAAGVAVSIRCVTQFQYTPPAPGRGGGRRGSRAGCGAGGNLRGYNKELGSQYAHSPSTGQNFLLDPSTQWNDTGPQGPGYYRPVGNSFEKLELGRSDDC